MFCGGLYAKGKTATDQELSKYRGNRSESVWILPPSPYQQAEKRRSSTIVHQRCESECFSRGCTGGERHLRWNAHGYQLITRYALSCGVKLALEQILDILA
jgi:hypothetical protein